MEKQTEFITTELKKFNVTDVAIKELNDKCMLLRIKSINDNEGYKKVKSARLVVKGKRVDVEKKRKELKADALTFGRAVDGEAKRITALLTPIENYLSVMEKAVDDEKEKIRFEKEQKAKLPLRIEKLTRLSVLITEEELLKMDDIAFANFYNKKREERIAEEERILAEKEAKIRESERKLEEKIKNERFEKRKEILIGLGFEYNEFAEYNFSLENIWSCFQEQIYNPTDKDFELYLEAINKAIEDNQKELRLKKENAAIKELKSFAADNLPDKEKVLIFAKTIESLTTVMPEVKSEKYKDILINAKKMLNEVSRYIKIQCDN